MIYQQICEKIFFSCILQCTLDKKQIKNKVLTSVRQHFFCPTDIRLEKNNGTRNKRKYLGQQSVHKGFQPHPYRMLQNNDTMPTGYLEGKMELQTLQITLELYTSVFPISLTH